MARKGATRRRFPRLKPRRFRRTDEGGLDWRVLLLRIFVWVFVIAGVAFLAFGIGVENVY